MLPKPTGMLPITNRDVTNAKGTEEAGGGEETCDQCVLSRKAGNRIPPTLPLSMCLTGTRLEYARYFHGIGIGKKIKVLSKSLTIKT